MSFALPLRVLHFEAFGIQFHQNGGAAPARAEIIPSGLAVGPLGRLACWGCMEPASPAIRISEFHGRHSKFMIDQTRKKERPS